VATKLGEAEAKLRAVPSHGPGLKPPLDGWPLTASVQSLSPRFWRSPQQRGIVSAGMTLMNFPRPLRHRSAGKGPS